MMQAFVPPVICYAYTCAYVTFVDVYAYVTHMTNCRDDSVMDPIPHKALQQVMTLREYLGLCLSVWTYNNLLSVRLVVRPDLARSHHGRFGTWLCLQKRLLLPVDT